MKILIEEVGPERSRVSSDANEVLNDRAFFVYNFCLIYALNWAFGRGRHEMIDESFFAFK